MARLKDEYANRMVGELKAKLGVTNPMGFYGVDAKTTL